jgi:hypothetical protein
VVPLLTIVKVKSLSYWLVTIRATSPGGASIKAGKLLRFQISVDTGVSVGFGLGVGGMRVRVADALGFGVVVGAGVEVAVCVSVAGSGVSDGTEVGVSVGRTGLSVGGSGVLVAASGTAVNGTTAGVTAGAVPHAPKNSVAKHRTKIRRNDCALFIILPHSR